MARQNPARLKRVIKAAKSQGWEADWTKNGHFRLSPPRGLRGADGELVAPVIFAATPSDHRADKNGIAYLRRAGVKV